VFFEDKDQGVFQCPLCGASRKQQLGSGYSNLLSHLNSTHPDFKEAYNASMINLPISEVDNPLTRSMSRLKPVSSKTLKADMQKVARNVGVLIEKETDNFFGVMWDGWSHSSVHYVGIYGVFIVKGKWIVRMLAMSPFEVVSDNCSSNHRIATLLELPLVGCASYRYNLAVNRYMAAYETEFAGLNQLMVQLRHCNNAAELAKLTDLAPVKRNMTRWSSTFEMVLRYKRIRDDVRQVEVVEEHVPTGAAHKKLMGRLEHLKKLDSVCKTLQDEGTSMA
ncbi:hypothetical protein JG688_00018481, partial [Phytophthora aleatoria]